MLASRLDRRRLGANLGLLTALALGGCAPDEGFPLPPVAWEGEMVRVRIDDSAEPACGGSFEALDRHAALVREALLLEGDEIIEYSVGDADFVDAGCSGSYFACAIISSGHVFTSSFLHQHEIVHATRILDPEIVLRSSAFEEGLATLFGTDDNGHSTHPLNFLELLDRDLVAGHDGYFRSGYAMATLFDRHGPEAFRDFDLLASNSMAEDAAFGQAFGETMEEFAAFAETEPLCEPSQWWISLLECDGEPITADADSGRLVLRGNLSCGEPDVYGPHKGDMWTSRHFRLEQSSNALTRSFDVPEGTMIEIVSCDGGCPERFAFLGTQSNIGGLGGNMLPSLEPGDYFLRVFRPTADDDGAFEIVLH